MRFTLLNFFPETIVYPLPSILLLTENILAIQNLYYEKFSYLAMTNISIST
jgi:hypothetical protein